MKLETILIRSNRFPRLFSSFPSCVPSFFRLVPQKFASSAFRSRIFAKGLAPGLYAYNYNPTGGETLAANANTTTELLLLGPRKSANYFNYALKNTFFTSILHIRTISQRQIHETLSKRQNYPKNVRLRNLVQSSITNRFPPSLKITELLFSSNLRVASRTRSANLAQITKNLFFARRFNHFSKDSENLIRRPTRDELLANSKGFFNRLMIRIKFSLMRQVRPFTMDDILAMFSWVFVGNTLFILIGTTSFFSILLATANSLQFQEFIARRIGNYLTKETGITIVFESAIVPNWKDGKIRLKNVSVKRHSEAGQQFSSHAANAEGADKKSKVKDINFTMFDLTIKMIDVELSFMRWLDGKGLVKTARVKGLRGIVDRRNVFWDPSVPYMASEWRRQPQPDDFELESFQLEDLLITIYQPDGFRPYNLSIFSADLPQLRNQWLLYDLLSAENIVGMFDNCLFNVHRTQMLKATTEEDLKEAKFKKQSCFQIHGLNIDHLNAGVPGPFGWITSGNVDIHAEFMFPLEPSNDPIMRIVNGIVDKIDDVVVQQRVSSIVRRHGGVIECEAQNKDDATHSSPVLIMSFEMRFHNIKASVPLSTPDLSYMNSALIRPIVAYMNNNRTVLSLRGQVSKSLNEFYGSWTLYDCSLVESVSIEVGKKFANVTMNAQKRNKQLKRVGWWGLQSMTKNLANIWDYATGQRGFWHYIGTTPV
ncbi:hypothetical protein G9A89_011853 [Geosiphon pyriformis]|nr:hypothetical protein G9A89_011853 [Geosiphon pyriformis]